MTQWTNKSQQSWHTDEAKCTERSLLFLAHLRWPLQPLRWPFLVCIWHCCLLSSTFGSLNFFKQKELTFCKLREQDVYFLLALPKIVFQNQSPFLLLSGQNTQIGVWSVTRVIYFRFSFKRSWPNNRLNNYQKHEEKTNPSLHWPYN